MKKNSIEATPAVVNPAIRSPHRRTIRLDGQWDFATDPEQVGDGQEWFKADTPMPGTVAIGVPGCWEAQGIGDPGMSASSAPEKATLPLRNVYVGAAWYRKEFSLPDEWTDRRIWLKIGGVHAQGWFWVNGCFLSHDACYCGTYKYDITDLYRPGSKNCIAVKVRNDVPSHKGAYGAFHRFGGLYRGVEIDATPQALIDYAYLTGDLDRRRAAAHMTIRSTAPEPVELDIEVNASTASGKPAGRASASLTARPGVQDLVVRFDLDPFLGWSPEEPNLYIADILLLDGGQPVDGWIERFGVRKWEVRGNSFYLNNRKFFVRGYGDDFLYPLTLCSPADKELHKQHFGKAKDFGFNYVRLHTHAELPEFFEAADEVGMMVQPELPYYGKVPSTMDRSHFRPVEDLKELITHYRRHVSLSTYCMGNEDCLGSPVDREVYRMGKQMDPDRLFLHQDGGHNTPENSDFGTGPVKPWTAVPHARSDQAEWEARFVPDKNRAWFSHEYLNLLVAQDPRLEGRYQGAMLPTLTTESFQESLRKSGLAPEWGTACVDAGHKLQSIFQKRGLEYARLDPNCGGFVYWTLLDVQYLGDQGLLDRFWGVKSSTSAWFREFNSDCVICAKFSPDQRVFAAGDFLAIEWWISHFGREPVRDCRLEWDLMQDDASLVSGKVEVSAEAGELKCIGSSRINIPMIDHPAKVKLVAAIEGRARNSWDLWLLPGLQPQDNRGQGIFEPVFSSLAERLPRIAGIIKPAVDMAGRVGSSLVPWPRDNRGQGICASEPVFAALKERYPGMVRLGGPKADKADTVMLDSLDERALRALESGKRVMLLGLPGPEPGIEPGWWVPMPQMGTAVANHPAFGGFPHEGHLNELLFRLVKNTIDTSNGDFRTLEPLMVGTGSQGYLVHVFQAKSGTGKLFASGLDLLSEKPEAVLLLDEFIKYVRSESFKPEKELDTGIISFAQGAEAAGEDLIGMNTSEFFLRYMPENIRQTLAARPADPEIADTRVTIVYEVSEERYLYTIDGGRELAAEEGDLEKPMVRIRVSKDDFAKIIESGNAEMLMSMAKGEASKSKFEILGAIAGSISTVLKDDSGDTFGIQTIFNDATRPHAITKMKASDFTAMLRKEKHPAVLFISGAIVIEGDLEFAIRIQPILE